MTKFPLDDLNDYSPEAPISTAADSHKADNHLSLPEVPGQLLIDAALVRSLRAQAHGLQPVVSISQKGLTAAVLQEIERSLRAHELIKIRIFEADRDNRNQLLQDICHTLAAAPVQHIGKLLVIWRPRPEAETDELPQLPTRPRRNPPRLTKKAAAAKTDKAARARPLERGKPRRPTRTR